jgi:hypothetical protein
VKLRILDDSIRLRLERDEVDRVAAGGTVHALTRFPNGSTLGYALRVAGATVDARLERDTLVVDVPARLALPWARDERAVSIHEKITTGNHPLVVLIEKDFECLEPRAGENQRNRFPNPNASRD